MSIWHDIIYWIGGYPFEVAAPDAIYDLHRARGFRLDDLRTANRSGCKQSVFVEKPST